MSSLAYTLSDSMTMLRRNLLHMIRYPALTLIVIAMPVVFLVLFVFVLGDTLGAGLGGAGAAPGNRAEYLAYLVPGILLFSIGGSGQGTATSVAMDMTEGIIARFRTMAISRAAVMTGHVLGNTIQTLIGLTVVVAITLLFGYRPSAGPIEWIGLFGLLALVSFAITWLSVALGMFTKSVENASNLPLPLILLPFFGSGFVPTNSMPDGLRWFAENQPFTPFIETARGLLNGTDIGSNGWISIAWCILISLASYLWARSLYNRKSVR